MKDKKSFPGKNLSHTQTCSSHGSYPPPVNQSKGSGTPVRTRTSHPTKATFPGKGLSNTNTTNTRGTTP